MSGSQHKSVNSGAHLLPMKLTCPTPSNGMCQYLGFFYSMRFHHCIFENLEVNEVERWLRGMV